MKPSRRVKPVGSIGIFILALLILIFLGGCQSPVDKSKEDKTAQPSKAVQRVSVENGQTILTLGAQDQVLLGIQVAPLQEISDREQVAATAVVLPIQDLAALRENYAADQTKLDKARVDLSVASREQERLRTLYQDNQNISEKALQAQEGIVQSAQAEAHADQQQLELEGAMAKQQWGPVVAQWLVENSANFQRLVNQQDLLLQVTPPQGLLQQPPETASVPIQDGRFIQARLLSAFPRLDPRIQNMSFLYWVPSAPGLVPGLNLSISLAAGSLRQGLLIPESSVLWFQGKAWIYQQTAPDRFTRREISTSSVVKNGYFVTSGFTPGDKVVIGAAQLLLSEESRPPVQPGAEKD